MAKKYINWKTKGMNRDMSVSAFNPEFAFENHNLRLSTNEGNTMMSWVNERGPKELKLHIDTKPWSLDESSGKYVNSIVGTPLGTAVLNHQLVLFTVDSSRNCYIYVFKESDKSDWDLTGRILYKGNLGFSTDYPIETLVSYESENIQKVYWTDNKNQPRVINIASSMDKTKNYNDSSFDFVQELALKEEVKVAKIFGSGEFPAGVIQYAFTYYNKYGQESNIFYTTPLQYISYVDRAGSPEDKISNCFKITVSNVDANFEYMRIYSILRTSKDGVPLVKRIQDIEIAGNTKLTYIDNGLAGETIDPTELLYKGGETIKAKTIEQKDDTLFLGNLTLTRPSLTIKNTILNDNRVTKDNPLANSNVEAVLTKRFFKLGSGNPMPCVNTLNSSSESTVEPYQGAACFKSREYYRLGVQFQYKNGKWSEPCWIGDKQCNVVPSMWESEMVYNLPEFKYTLKNVLSTLYSQGYRRVRPLFVLPGTQDRTLLCQGIGAPTVYRQIDRDGKLYGMASWLFRTNVDSKVDLNVLKSALYNGGGYVSSSGKLNSQFDTPYYSGFGTTHSDNVVSPYLSSTEVMGDYDDDNAFRIDPFLITINSPDVEFDDAIIHTDLNGYNFCTVGYSTFNKTFGDIEIQTSTPAIGSDAAGFLHRNINAPGSAALISGLFYNDYLVDDKDSTPTYGAYNTKSPAIDFPVFMWHKNGSLNNDVSRDNRSAVLLKKKISNYRLGGVTTYSAIGVAPVLSSSDNIQLFNSDELTIVKVNGNTYQGNVDTMVTPSTPSPYYFVGDPWRSKVDTDKYSRSYYKLALADPTDTSSKSGVWVLTYENNDYKWQVPSGDKVEIGDNVKGLDQWREGISIKYKSTPHLVGKINSLVTNGVYTKTFENGKYTVLSEGEVPIIEVFKEYSKDVIFGGTSDDALQAATWIPCGPPVSFDADTTSVEVNFKWGDTYFQRYECLKTYPFTHEDKNQVVEIASFMVETRVNIDGRYDRNRGQISNLNMTPQNFNLINPVYSQMDNFFSYKMVDEDNYKNTIFPNTVTWTKTKQSGADVDLWTNITLANTLEMDGNKGGINKLVRFNNQLLSFQDSGISQILYNENTQISTTEGVPIEIANSQKVQGKRYYSDTVGCSNKWSVVQTPAGIYFMDSNEKSIYLFNGQLNNLSTTGGFNSWAKQNIPSANVEWTPTSFSSFVAYYDKLNQDVLFINNTTALAFSEKFNCFTSFYDYDNVPFFVSLDDREIWVKGQLWEHQAGEYCNFFDKSKPFSMTLVANQEPQIDKMFTNLEFRACVEGDGTASGNSFTPWLPFDTLEVWDEYQHGVLSLDYKNGHDRFTHGTKDNSSHLARKFRMWSCDIPRDNAPVDANVEAAMGIKRSKVRPLDRIRNPWAYIKLTKNADSNLNKREIHDIMATYFG